MCKKRLFLPGLVIFALCVLLNIFSIKGQDYLWQEVPGFNTITQIEEVGSSLYIVSEGSLFVISDKANITTPNIIGTKEGLSSHGVEKICYNLETKTLLVYYKDGTLDLITEGKPVTSISAIANNVSVTNYSAYRMVSQGDLVYLATGFGIAKVNTATSRIDATYFIHQRTKDVAVTSNTLFVVDEEGKLWQGSESSNLQDPSQWEQINTQPWGINEVDEIATLGSSLLLLEHKTGMLILFNPVQKKAEEQAKNVRKLFVTPYAVYANTEDGLKGFENNNGDYKLIPLLHNVDALTNNSNRAGYAVNGAVLYQLNNDGIIGEPTVITYNGPSTNSIFSSFLRNGYYYAVAGGRGTDRNWQQGALSVKDNKQQWSSIIRQNVPETYRSEFWDLVSVVADPSDPQHIFTSSWGNGLFEIRNGEIVKQYTLSNSPLESALPGKDYANLFVRVSSLFFDKDENLWMTQGNIENNIHILTKEGQWVTLTYPEARNVDTFGSFVQLANGTLWLNVLRHGSTGIQAIYVINTMGTLSDSGDDKVYYISQFPDRNGKLIEATYYNAMILDKNGVLWLGTNKGPLVINNPNLPISEGKTPIATRPVGGKEPNLYYVLDNVFINTLAVDAKNNKWVGTANDGLYLLSADGSEILEHFNRYNSPLMSNTIRTLELDEQTGTLYIATGEGLICYNTGSNAFTNESKSSVHVFPNPLRPENPDDITFTGLVSGMELKIVNASGELIHMATSSGASYKFYARNARGERLPAGVYTALLYDPTSKVSYHIRFAIIQ